MFNIDVVLSGWVVFIENAILDVLKKSDVSLTINEVAERVNAHRITVSKYLAVLEARGIIKRRDVGKAKLFYLKEENSRV
jgi:DNA-binding IclR family transcriptional regulator